MQPYHHFTLEEWENLRNYLTEGKSLRKIGSLLGKTHSSISREHQNVLSLSLDNGSEFAAFKQIEEELNIIVYFADPHSPWQRGSNENINGLLRFFFPKGTNFLEITQEYLDYILTLINNRPRKCLGWLSPVEFMQKCCT